MAQGLGKLRSVAVAVGGFAAVLGLYWDDAWHTDVGRDEFFSRPHLLLYAGVAVLLVAAVSWAWSNFRRVGWQVLREPVLMLPLGGAAITLGAAPLDELWHQLFGRDAVTWSPPHMVAVAGMFAFAAGLFLAVTRTRGVPRLVPPVVGAFLLAAAVTPVMEFETDVPQFPVVLYWPVLVGMIVFAFSLIRRLSDRPWATTEAAALYVVLRLAVVAFLAALGHSLPTVMPTVIAAAVFDRFARRDVSRSQLATVTTVTVIGSHWAAHVFQPAGLWFRPVELMAGAVLAVGAAWLALAAAGTGRGRSRWQGGAARRVSTAAAALVVATLAFAGPAAAHDPGQGEGVASVTLTATRSGDRIELLVRGDDGSCGGWEPGEVLARRAGRTHVAPLVSGGGCVHAGAVTVDDPGRWFVYAEIKVDGRVTEAWIPVEHTRQVKATELYTPTVRSSWTPQIVAGVVLYALVAAIFVAVATVFRRAATTLEPVQEPVRS